MSQRSDLSYDDEADFSEDLALNRIKPGHERNKTTLNQNRPITDEEADEIFQRLVV